MSKKNDITTYKLKKFDPRWIKRNSRLVFIGKTMTGKSTLVKDCLFHHRDIASGICISGTDDGVESYSLMIPGIAVHDKYNSDLIENLITQQKQKRLYKKRYYEQKYGRKLSEAERKRLTKPSPVFLIMDDCLYGNAWTKDEQIRYIFMNGRHNQIFFLLTMQHPMGIPPELRTQLDYIFLLRENIQSNRKKIYEHYAGMFPNLNVFCNVMDNCTENYECLVIANNAHSNKIEDQVFWYKAKLHDDFKIGSREFWAFNDRNFNDRYNDKEAQVQMELTKLTKRYGSRRQKILVEKKGN